MTRMRAALLLALALALTAAAIALPWLVGAALALAGVALMRERRAFLGLFAAALAVQVALLAIVAPGAPFIDLGPLRFGLEGAWIGAQAAFRLGGALAVNLALLSRVGGARLIEGLRLPPRATALLAAVLLAAHDVARDWERLKTARRLEDAWPRGRLARARAGAALVPHLLLAAHRRATTRREALQLAGHAMPAWFVPVVAVAALGAAGRMAFLALPNVALTYVVAFLGGLLFGPIVAALGALLGMALTDLLLTGLYPLGFVNAPAMALLALLGGAMRRYPFDGDTRPERAAGAAMAACVGIVGTLLFSVASDVLTWALVLQDQVVPLRALVLAGLAFNVIPAAVNGAIFAASVGPTVRAFRATGGTPAPTRPAPAPPPEPDASPGAPG